MISLKKLGLGILKGIHMTHSTAPSFSTELSGVVNLNKTAVTGETSSGNFWTLSEMSTNTGFTLKGPSLLIEFLQSQAAFPEEFQRCCQISLKRGWSFRREISFQGYTLLFTFLPTKKCALVTSRRASQELLLLKSSQDYFTRELEVFVQDLQLCRDSELPSEWEFLSELYQLCDFSPTSVQLSSIQLQQLDRLSQEKLTELTSYVSAYKPTLFERFSDWGLSLVAQYDVIRIHLLKFLAQLPSLDHDTRGVEVKRSLKEALRRLLKDDKKLRQMSRQGVPTAHFPHWLLGLFQGAYFVADLLPAAFVAFSARSLVRKMARRFIAGESIETSQATLDHLAKTHREATLDQLGELVVSDGEAQEYLSRVLTLINGLKAHIPKGSRNKAGILKAHVSIKVSALSHDFKPLAFEDTYNMVGPRLKKILLTAQKEEVFINIDAEHIHFRDLVFQIYRKVLLSSPELQTWGDTGIVVQAYLKDASVHLREVIQLAQERKVMMPIRLVKGAYWDAETIEAKAHSFKAVQFLNKEETDLHFRQLCLLTLQSAPHLQLTIGSHNLQDHCFVEALRESCFPQAPVIEHQCLHMTYEALSYALADCQLATRNYMPVGNLLVGMSYLVRRIMENSSQVGVLTMMRSHQKEEAFKSPQAVHQEKKQHHLLQREPLEGQLSESFKNVPPSRWYVPLERESFVAALKLQEAHLMSLASFGQRPEKSLARERVIVSSSRPESVVGLCQDHTPEEAQDLARTFFTQAFSNQWTTLEPAQRVASLIKASELMWMKKNQLAALIVWEAGKSASEAMADVDEAIDFINFYVREYVKNLKAQNAEGLSEGSLKPRGVTLVIAPWNFPLAIPCGMCVAPLVSGNPVILKPAEQTPLITLFMRDLFYQAGIPATAFQILLGEGEKVAAPLVSSPYIANIVFTGSKSVGQWIYQAAQMTLAQDFLTPGEQISRRVITEMGGKNAIIVTNNCEMDETISGILYSAFAHAGQKCSACSRVIVHEDLLQNFMLRLKNAVLDLKVGPADKGSTFMNPLISQFDQERVKKAMHEAKEEALNSGGKVWVDRSDEFYDSFIVGPVVIELPLSQAHKPESWAQREVFGPLLHVIAVPSLQEAVRLFNATEYALTGGIYAQSQDQIDWLLPQLQAGNLYVNRPNTGARVGIEPFGGFKYSGTGPKAGGVDYIFSFVRTEKSARQKMVSLKVSEEAVSSGYEMSQPEAQVNTWEFRWRKSLLTGEKILSRYESLFYDAPRETKEKFEIFFKWLQETGVATVCMPQDNHKIPGQLSYDLRSLSRKSLMVCTQFDALSFGSLTHVMTALFCGLGVRVGVTHSSGFARWCEFKKMLEQNGWDKEVFDVALLSKEHLQRDLTRFTLSNVLIEGDENFYEGLSQFALKGPSGSFMRHIEWGTFSLASTPRPKALISLYTYNRSFAINTMRHGAPLELESL